MPQTAVTTQQPMSVADIRVHLDTEFPGCILEASDGLDMPCIRLTLEHLVPALRWLRDADGCRFSLLTDLTCVDFLEREPRYDVVYHLYSLASHSRLRVKVGVSDESSQCPSACEVWPGANWLEREVFDMYGIDFTNHPDPRRILSPEGWTYFALRRDFPLQGPGTVKLYDSVSDVF